MPRGGLRKGAGRPAGSGKYGEPTVALRVPQSLRDHLVKCLEDGAFRIPLYGSKVAAGFPSLADDFVEARIDANSLVVENPVATFFLRVRGDSMRDAGIFDDDYIAVDRSLEAQSGDIVVAALDGEFTVKRLLIVKGKPRLHPENTDFPDLVPAAGEDLRVFGVVCGLVRRLRQSRSA